MSTIHLHQANTLPPEHFVGLTDFGPGWSKLSGSSADEYLRVHHGGHSQADVEERASGFGRRRWQARIEQCRRFRRAAPAIKQRGEKDRIENNCSVCTRSVG